LLKAAEIADQLTTVLNHLRRLKDPIRYRQARASMTTKDIKIVDGLLDMTNLLPDDEPDDVPEDSPRESVGGLPGRPSEWTDEDYLEYKKWEHFPKRPPCAPSTPEEFQKAPSFEQLVEMFEKCSKASGEQDLLKAAQNSSPLPARKSEIRVQFDLKAKAKATATKKKPAAATSPPKTKPAAATSPPKKPLKMCRKNIASRAYHKAKNAATSRGLNKQQCLDAGRQAAKEALAECDAKGITA
jgi:hypothetical protein